MIWVAVGMAGGLGALCRYLTDHAVSLRVGGRFPWGTVLVNVTGSLAAGFVAGLAAGAVVPAEAQVVVAGGFLGAYTTFSTAMYETVRLAEDGAPLAGLANLGAPMVLSVAAAWAGWALAT